MNELIRHLWDKLGDTTINGDDEIEADYLMFPAGTHREEIWQWFESTFNISVVELMYNKKVTL